MPANALKKIGRAFAECGNWFAMVDLGLQAIHSYRKAAMVLEATVKKDRAK